MTHVSKQTYRFLFGLSHLQFAMKPNYLHIWPRNTFMMIALPNLVSVALFFQPAAVAVINTLQDMIDLWVVLILLISPIYRSIRILGLHSVLLLTVSVWCPSVSPVLLNPTRQFLHDSAQPWDQVKAADGGFALSHAVPLSRNTLELSIPAVVHSYHGNGDSAKRPPGTSGCWWIVPALMGR